MKKIIQTLVGLVLAICFTFASAVPSFAYTVKEGDSLNSIAEENGISVDEILQMNPEIDDRNIIFPGQEINLGKDFYHRVNLTAAEKKAIKSLFDYEYYKENNPDVVEQLGDSEEALWAHFLTYGLWETRQPNKDFNVNAYASAYKDVREALVTEDLGQMVKNLTLHYVLIGKEEGRTTTTIESCLNQGKNVLYYGSYDDETPDWVEEHVIATAKEPDPPHIVTYREAYYSSCLTFYYRFHNLINNTYPEILTYSEDTYARYKEMVDAAMGFSSDEENMFEFFSKSMHADVTNAVRFITGKDEAPLESFMHDFEDAFFYYANYLDIAKENPEACPYPDLKQLVLMGDDYTDEDVERLIGHIGKNYY